MRIDRDLLAHRPGLQLEIQRRVLFSHQKKVILRLGAESLFFYLDRVRSRNYLDDVVHTVAVGDRRGRDAG